MFATDRKKLPIIDRSLETFSALTSWLVDSREEMFMNKERLTVAHALIRFLDAQYVERDGIERKFFHGCFGILGHGNIGGIGAALLRIPSFGFIHAATNRRWCISPSAMPR